MAGHSKWANIKHRKGAQDAKRAQLFNKFSKEIIVAAQMGGGDVNTNSALRLAVTKAKAQSMPKKNIENAIAKGAGEKGGATYFEASYGGNVSGVSFLVNCLTDNSNRLAANIQFYFNKAGGAVSGVSAVSYIFDRKGVLELAKANIDEETLMMQAIEAGAEDFEATDESYLIYTEPASFSDVKENLEKLGYTEFTTAEVKYLPNQEVVVPKEKAEAILEFIDKLEDDEDIQVVYHNLDASSLD